MTALLFLGFVGAVAVTVALVLRVGLSGRSWFAAVGLLALWLIYVGTLSWSGIIADPARRPPAILYIIGPVMLFVFLVAVRSKAAGRFAAAVPLGLLIGLQVFRIGVELFLHQLWGEGLVPRMLTYAGANVDIWIGLSAPLVAWLATRGLTGLRVAQVWNVAGLLALANVILRSALTSPGPLHMIDAEVVNSAIGSYPYTFIAGFLAPLAITLHVLALRAIASRRTTPNRMKELHA